MKLICKFLHNLWEKIKCFLFKFRKKARISHSPFPVKSILKIQSAINQSEEIKA